MMAEFAWHYTCSNPHSSSPAGSLTCCNSSALSSYSASLQCMKTLPCAPCSALSCTACCYGKQTTVLLLRWSATIASCRFCNLRGSPRSISISISIAPDGMSVRPESHMADLALCPDKADDSQAAIALHPARAGPMLHGLHDDCHTVVLAHLNPHLQQPRLYEFMPSFAHALTAC